MCLLVAQVRCNHSMYPLMHSIVSRFANEHCANNLSDYVESTFPAGEGRVLFTPWVGLAWEELSSNTDMIKRRFRKCGISVSIDGSTDDDINLKGLSVGLGKIF